MVPKSLDLECVGVVANYFGLREMVIEVADRRREGRTDACDSRHRQMMEIVTKIREDVHLLTQQQHRPTPYPRPPPPPFPGPDPDFPRPPSYFGFGHFNIQ